MQNNIKIRLSVDNFYDNISKNKQKTKIDPKELSKSLGYDEKIWDFLAEIQLTTWKLRKDNL